MSDLESTADTEGPAWDAAAAGWVGHWADFAAPAREAVARVAGISAGMSVLDLGCGGGEFCALAAAHGARVSGVDAAAGLVAIGQGRVPDADLRVGSIERLPWADSTFDLVTGFNALQFTADVVAALHEARRVTRVGGHIAICNWGRVADREMEAIFRPMSRLKPPRARPAPPVDEPGVLEDLARTAGLVPVEAADVDVPYVFPDRTTLERAMLALVPAYGARLEDAEHIVATTIATAAAPYQRADGSYRFENRYRYVFLATS